MSFKNPITGYLGYFPSKVKRAAISEGKRSNLHSLKLCFNYGGTRIFVLDYGSLGLKHPLDTQVHALLNILLQYFPKMMSWAALSPGTCVTWSESGRAWLPHTLRHLTFIFSWPGLWLMITKEIITKTRLALVSIGNSRCCFCVPDPIYPQGVDWRTAYRHGFRPCQSAAGLEMNGAKFGLV